MSDLGLELTGLYDCALLAIHFGIPESETRAIVRAIDPDARYVTADQITVAMHSWTRHPDGYVAPSPTTVYLARDGDGDLLYVGITGKRVQRMHVHAKSSQWWPLAATVTLEHYPERSIAEARERLLIRNEHPAFNIAGRIAA